MQVFVLGFIFLAFPLVPYYLIPRWLHGVKNYTHLNVEGATVVARMAVEEIKVLKLPIADHLR
jgi:hypothetical protein